MRTDMKPRQDSQPNLGPFAFTIGLAFAFISIGIVLVNTLGMGLSPTTRVDLALGIVTVSLAAVLVGAVVTFGFRLTFLALLALFIIVMFAGEFGVYHIG